MRIKLLSYNIMSGGFLDYDPILPTPERLPLIKEVVSSINADFVGLIDTYRWDTYFSPHELTTLFNYPHVYSVCLNDESLKKIGHDNGISVLSRIPVSDFKTIRLHNRDAIKTSLATGKQQLDIFSVYFDHASEDTRLKQLRGYSAQ
jgi:endonuclease/exonuclease/phosphatase family metal-dependent hydrolase